jgi:hypothetical protein
VRPAKDCRCCGDGATHLCSFCVKHCVMANGPTYILIPSDRKRFNPHNGRKSKK